MKEVSVKYEIMEEKDETRFRIEVFKKQLKNESLERGIVCEDNGNEIRLFAGSYEKVDAMLSSIENTPLFPVALKLIEGLKDTYAEHLQFATMDYVDERVKLVG